ncbi:MAG TPA: replication initiation factor domain-containing protein, partial [Gammaproteobacteria bacterium]|nr:replication initiation factor domain-containing protein [Gammaproteobacteria bacterium]
MYNPDDPGGWARSLLADFGFPDRWQEGFGRYSYAEGIFHADIRGMAVCWGGERAAGTLYVSVPGAGCEWVEDWVYVAQVLETLGAKLTRTDVAADDYEGAYYSVDQARRDFEAGRFVTSGHPPKGKFYDDMGSGEGNTMQVGKRANGKQARTYDKGKEQGDPNSPWVRIEAEFHAKDRQIPYEVLYKPGEYLAGAYPAFSWASVAKQSIRTVKEKALHTVTSLFRHARRAYGQLVRLMVEECGQDPALVALAMIRDGTPGSLRATPDWALPDMAIG